MELKYTNSNSQLSQDYFSALEKGGIRSFFLSFPLFSLGLDPLYDPFSSYLYEVISSCWVDTRVASSRQPSFPASQGSLLKSHLTHFLYCHKLSLFCFLDRSLVDISISPSSDVMRNYVTPGAKATAAWHIGHFKFSRFAQVVSR